MNHENLPDDTTRHQSHPHVTNRKSEGSSEASPCSQPDPNSPQLWESQRLHQPPDQQALPGLDDLPHNLAAFSFEGPTPHPFIIDQYNQIKPGMGDRIMDDAHEDMVIDRKITQESFSYAIFEAKARLAIAIAVIVSCPILITVFLFALDPPESLVGAGLVGLASLTPLIATLLNKPKPPPEPTSEGK